VTLLRSFGIVGLQDSRCLVVVAVWYRQYSQYFCMWRLTVFFTATVYRGISWPWRYLFHCHVSRGLWL